MVAARDGRKCRCTTVCEVGACRRGVSLLPLGPAVKRALVARPMLIKTTAVMGEMGMYWTLYKSYINCRYIEG